MSKETPKKWWKIYPWHWRKNYNDDPLVLKWKLKGKWERDWQRQKVYDAEREAWRVETKEYIEKIPDIERYVNKLAASAWFATRFGGTWRSGFRSIGVKDSRGSTAHGSGFGGGTLTLPTWARTKWVILHELAHVVNPRSYGSSHGRHFARIYLELIRHELGEDAYKRLKTAYIKYKVKYRPQPHGTAKAAACKEG